MLNPCTESTESPGFQPRAMRDPRQPDAPRNTLDDPCTVEEGTLRSAAFPTTTLRGHASQVLFETAMEPRCSWIMVTQLFGETNCSLSCGHDGEHCFSVDQ
jgi:hypothetical protein